MTERKRLNNVELIEILKEGKQVNVYFNNVMKSQHSPYKLGDCGDVIDVDGVICETPFWKNVTHEIIEPKLVRWVNIYSNDNTDIYPTKETADLNACTDRLRCVRVEV